MLRSFTSRSFGVLGLVIGVSVFLSGCSASAPNVEGVVSSVDVTDPEPAGLGTYEEYSSIRSLIRLRSRVVEPTPWGDLPTEGEMVYSGVASLIDIRRGTWPPQTLLNALGAADATVNFETKDASVRIYDLVNDTGEQVTGEVVASGGLFHMLDSQAYFRTGELYGEISWADQAGTVRDPSLTGLFYGPNGEIIGGGIGGTFTLEDGSEHDLYGHLHLER